MATILSKPQLRAVTLSKRLPILPRTCSCQSRFTLQQYQCISTGRMTPKIADASMWNSVIPKFLRSGSQKGPKQGADAGIMERHPSVFYILMFILIGSQAIHLLQLRTSHENFLRSTNSKIRQLSEVIDRLKNGEDVDVRKTLGTGNKASEDEWEEVLREIEQEELEWRSKLDAIQSNENHQHSDTPKDHGTPKRPPQFY
ncbi:TPA_exp: hypothetical protein A8136_2241 [Trichophyton benhamiae CBS 112371]|nr:TPA_exp: hypothetical protein A8136_2241 [Trichophyton benhamiae CBS 112371]